MVNCSLFKSLYEDLKGRTAIYLDVVISFAPAKLCHFQVLMASKFQQVPIYIITTFITKENPSCTYEGPSTQADLLPDRRATQDVLGHVDAKRPSFGGPRRQDGRGVTTAWKTAWSAIGNVYRCGNGMVCRTTTLTGVTAEVQHNIE